MAFQNNYYSCRSAEIFLWVITWCLERFQRHLHDIAGYGLVNNLQRKINVLYNVSCILGLEVHAGISNIVVFRNGGQLAANEKWHIGTTDLNVVSEYTYLGIVMSTRLSSTCIQNHLATRARSAVAKIDKSLRHLHYLELEVLINIFDTQAKPILLYGAEVWGM